jgi:pyruvate dehydrogenase E2 component (dihydrolipoamide acetyltransferase)
MSVSVLMPQLGESVTEGTVTRWLKKEGEQVTADEPLLEVSTDKVDTEIPAPASGILRGIVVDEDETVAVGAQLAVIEDADAPAATPAPAAPAPAPAAAAPAPAAPTPTPTPTPAPAPAAEAPAAPPAPSYPPPAPAPAAPSYAPPSYAPPAPASAPANGGQSGSANWSWNEPATPSAPSYAPPASPAPAAYSPPAPSYQPPAAPAPAPPAAAPAPPPAPASSYAPPAPEPEAAVAESYPEPTPLPAGDSPYVTPLVRKLAAEHSVPLESIVGTGVGGRIRKQDVIDASAKRRADEAAAAAASAPAPAAPAAAPAAAAPAAPEAKAAPARPAVVPDALRGTTQRMSRPRQVIAKRMVESLQTSAQLTTVVEVDVTNIARLRDRAKAAFEAREGVKLTFLPFFAQATVEALKIHPKLNSVINAEAQEVTYHAAEHLGIAVDTERGLMVPVIHGAGDLNIGGLARKISDLASRTRSGQVGPDELAGGTFTLTNTGSRGALFDTPIINLPQVGILGVGSVVKRAVVVDDPALGEVIAVRSMVYLALTYDHRLVDGADAARFLVTVKNRLEEGAFEADLGL